MEITDRIRNKLFQKGIKHGVYRNEKGITVDTNGVVVYEAIEKFKEWFGEFDVKIYKSKSEEITIEVCQKSNREVQLDFIAQQAQDLGLGY